MWEERELFWTHAWLGGHRIVTCNGTADLTTEGVQDGATGGTCTENGSRNIPNTMCGLVGTFLISAKMFLIPCVLWAISGTISNMFLIPNNIRNNLCVPDIMWNNFQMFLIWRCLLSFFYVMPCFYVSQILFEMYK